MTNTQTNPELILQAAQDYIAARDRFYALVGGAPQAARIEGAIVAATAPKADGPSLAQQAREILAKAGTQGILVGDLFAQLQGNQKKATLYSFLKKAKHAGTVKHNKKTGAWIAVPPKS